MFTIRQLKDKSFQHYLNGLGFGGIPVKSELGDFLTESGSRGAPGEYKRLLDKKYISVIKWIAKCVIGELKQEKKSRDNNIKNYYPGMREKYFPFNERDVYGIKIYETLHNFILGYRIRVLVFGCHSYDGNGFIADTCRVWCRLKIKKILMYVFVLGFHKKLGMKSPILQISRSPIFDKNILKIIHSISVSN